MAIIYSYPEIPDVQGGDLLLISDTGAPNKPTRSVDIDDLAAYIGTVVGVVQNLQSVLTVGNTYVSPDGYGTFTLNNIADNNGDIKYVNTDEGWGYFLNAEEGLFFTDGTGGQTGRTGIGLDTVFIGNSNHIGIIRSANITADRTYELPNASGTIALENLSNWYSVTGSRGLGNLLVKIGDYDNSGNGTFLSIDDADQSMTFTKGGVVESKFVFTATQDRDYTFPNADGTIALTSDIPTPGPSGSGTTNYTARWTNASTLGIGALYDNGTNVGIGTISPSEKLDVEGNARVGQNNGFYINNQNVGIKRDSNDLVLGGFGNVIIKSSNTTVVNQAERMRITSGGNVGIGTTSPGSTLPTDSETATKVLQLTGVSGSTGDTAVLLRSSDNSSGLDLWHNASTGDSYIDNRYNSNQGDTIFRVKTAGTPLEALRITGDGNVGIGTTSPSEKLDVRGNVYIEGSFPYIKLKQNTSGLQEYSIINEGSFTIEKTTLDSGGDFIIKDEHGKTPLSVSMGLIKPSTVISGELFVKDRDGLTTKLYVNESNGNVGIGTTSPASILHLKSDTSTLTLESSDTTLNPDQVWASLDFKQNDGSQTPVGSVANISAVAKAGNTNFGNLLFQTKSRPVDTYNDTLFLSSSGNVGIGTTSPSEKLHVFDTAVVVKIEGNGVTSANLKFKTNETDRWNLNVPSGSTDLRFTTGSSDTLTLKSSGNVGIGTTSPSTKLHVNGDVRIQGENQLYLGGATSVPNWEITASGSDLIVNDTGTNVGSVLFNNDEGVALPRLTTTEINAISSPTQGLMAYNTTLNTLCFYNGSSWQKVSHTSM